MSRMSKWRCFRTVVGCRRLSFDGTDRIVPPGKVSGVSLAVACALSRAPCPCTPIIPSPFHFHTRCGDAMLAYAAAACCVAAAYHHNMPGWTCGQCHPPSWLRNLHTTPIHRPSIAPTEYLRSRARPGAAGVPTGDTATPRPCRVPVADGARRGLTARHHTPRQLGLPPFHREPQRACRPGGPWRAGCRLPSLRYALLLHLPISPCIARSLLPCRPCLPIATKTACSV